MKYALLALAALALGLLTACAGSGIQGNIKLGPYGDYTSGTLNLDATPFLPPAKSYNADLQQLEK